MPGTVNGMSIEEVRDRLKNLISSSDWVPQDKTGFLYLKGAMLRKRVTELLGLNLSINSLRSDWRVMPDNVIVAFSTMELVIRDDDGNEVCRSSATGESTSFPKKDGGGVNYGSEITSAETDAFKAALQAWVIMEKPKGVKGSVSSNSNSYSEDLNFRVKVTQQPSILGNGVVKAKALVGKEEKMLVIYESVYESMLNGRSANEFALDVFKPSAELVVAGRESNYKGEKQIIISSFNADASTNASVPTNAAPAPETSPKNTQAANKFKVKITDRAKLLDNGMVTVPIELNGEAIEMVVYSKTVQSIVSKNGLANPQAYADSFSGLVGKTPTIKGTLKTFNGKKQLVYNN